MKKDEIIEEESVLEENEDSMDAIAMIEEMLADMNKIEIDTTEVEGSKIDKKEFVKGVKEVSKLAGMFSCLKSVGASEDSIMAYILNERNIEHTQFMQGIVNETQLEVSKVQSLVMDNHQV